MNKKQIVLIFVISIEVLVIGSLYSQYFTEENRRYSIYSANEKSSNKINFGEVNITLEEAKKYLPSEKNIPRFPLNCSKESKNPDLYWELKKNYSQFFDGYSGRFLITKIDTNSVGFRDEEFPKTEYNSSFRIVALGDSITFGWGVNNSDIWTEVLENKLNQLNLEKHFQVLNFGVWGYNTRMEVEVFEEKAMDYNPDLIIIQFHRNDNQNHTRILKMKKIFRKQLKEKTNLSRQKIRIAVGTKARTVENNFRKGSGLDMKLETVQRSLKKLKKITKEEDIPVVIAAWPIIGYQESILKSISERYGWYYVNLWEEMEMDRNFDKYTINDGHPNSQGHEVMAKKIYDKLNNTHVLDN